MTRPQTHPTTRHDLWWLGLLLMIASAALVVGAGWLLLSWYLSLGQYIRSAA